MRRLMNMLVVAMVAGPALVLGQAGDVNKILADMRAALGGADKVAAVKTVTAIGRTQRTTSNGTATESELELAMELPDKYVTRNAVVNMGTMSIYRNSGFNGNGVINETEAPPNLGGGGGGPVMMFRSAGGPAPGQTPTPEQKAEMDQRMLMSSKKDFARMTLGMFGTSYEVYPLEFSYAGQAEAADGKAHVIAVKGADNFDAKLFVDAATNLPLMLSWNDREPMVMTQQMNRGGGAGGGGQLTEEDIKKMQADMAAREAARKVVEFRVYYSNFKAVNGVKLPHTLQRSIDGKPTEETTFDQIKINPKIDSKKFTVTK